ncbi:hypothetical protein X975_23915, partial [Stegodyphus mimosarum]
MACNALFYIQNLAAESLIRIDIIAAESLFIIQFIYKTKITGTIDTVKAWKH